MGEWEVPEARGSLVFNIKNYLSSVLFALVDANCKFLLVDVGAYEKAQRGGGGCRNVPEIKYGQNYQGRCHSPTPPHSSTDIASAHMKLPHVSVRDEAFS